jgi:hypothetical protein
MFVFGYRRAYRYQSENSIFFSDMHPLKKAKPPKGGDAKPRA